MTDPRLARRRDRIRAGFGRTYLVECFASTGLAVELADWQARGLGAATAAAHRRIEYVAALALPEDEQIFLVIRGLDARSVRTACLEVGLAVERVAEVAIRRGGSSPCPHRTRDLLAPRAAGCRR